MGKEIQDKQGAFDKKDSDISWTPRNTVQPGDYGQYSSEDGGA